MRVSAIHNPGYDCNAGKLTPMQIVLRPALRGGVSRSGEDLRPRPFNPYSFDPNLNGCSAAPISLFFHRIPLICPVIITLDIAKLRCMIFTYDQNGNLLTTETTTTYTYDNLNKQTSVSQPGQDENGQAVTITQTKTYNWEGQPLTETDARGNTTTYQYNQRGQLEKTIDPLGGTTALYYDHGGRIIAEVSPVNYRDGIELTNLNRVEYTYDTKDRQLTKTDIYQDPVTNQWPTVISRARQYDPNGNLSRETDALGYETTYTYNLANQCTQELDPVSQEKGLPYTKQYAYDTLGRVLTHSQGKNDGTETITLTYQYDANGNKGSETDSNGSLTQYTYEGVFDYEKNIYRFMLWANGCYIDRIWI